MEKFLLVITPLLDKASFRNVLALGLLIAFCLIGYVGYIRASVIGDILFSRSTINKPFTSIPLLSEQAINVFMKKHQEILYLSIFAFKFQTNTRLPIYQSYNSDEFKKLIQSRLNGGDGALPIFIKGDSSNNDQIISIITGQISCDPFLGGGLSRVWPDLADRITMSCRVPIPPVFGDSIPGYMVVHVHQKLTPYELEVLKLDMIILSKLIDDNNRQ